MVAVEFRRATATNDGNITIENDPCKTKEFDTKKKAIAYIRGSLYDKVNNASALTTVFLMEQDDESGLYLILLKRCKGGIDGWQYTIRQL